MHLPTAANSLRPYIERCKDVPIAGGHATSIAHLYEMIDAMETGKVSGEKGHRWLGWVQAVICCRGGATLDELKLENYKA